MGVCTVSVELRVTLLSPVTCSGSLVLTPWPLSWLLPPSPGLDGLATGQLCGKRGPGWSQVARGAGLSVAKASALGSSLASTTYWLGTTPSKPLTSRASVAPSKKGEGRVTGSSPKGGCED